jgi:hypothetical protein
LADLDILIQVGIGRSSRDRYYLAVFTPDGARKPKFLGDGPDYGTLWSHPGSVVSPAPIAEKGELHSVVEINLQAQQRRRRERG